MKTEDKSIAKVKSCRGCSHSNYQNDELLIKIQDLLDESSLENIMKSHAKSQFLYHHPFDITLARCPNSCSRPQLADISIVAMNKPVLTDNSCIKCGMCVKECKEDAIVLEDKGPVFNYDKCINCGDCIRVCPTGTISSLGIEFQFSVGGRLGRHPRFAMEMGRSKSIDEIIDWTGKTIQLYADNIKGEERFSVVLDRYGVDNYRKNILKIEN